MSGFGKRPSGSPSARGFFHLRVDERLIHGQVVVGWGIPLEINCLILANDQTAGNVGDKELYLQIIPEGMGGSVRTVDQAVAATAEIRRRGERCLMVVRSVEDALKWIASGNPPDLLILGGVHPEPGRRRVLDYISLSDDEIGKLRSILQQGIKVVCQDVWGGNPVDLEEALRRARINR
ncbi:MAG TPA: PTS sugar transporter subunit IIB [bacterium]|jgi:mannose/fructose/N-acetylgalactosamine-specific phosphotransferase system component IIB